MNEVHRQVAASIRARVDAATERQHGTVWRSIDREIINELCRLAWDMAARFRETDKHFPRTEFITACGFKL